MLYCSFNGNSNIDVGAMSVLFLLLLLLLLLLLCIPGVQMVRSVDEIFSVLEVVVYFNNTALSSHSLYSKFYFPLN